MDLPEAEENLSAMRQRFPDREIVPVSAKENEGIEELKEALDRRLREPDLERVTDPAVLLMRRP